MQSTNPTGNRPGDCTVVTFDANWHHNLGHKLEVFPRSIPLAGEVFWPDLASFLEDNCSRQMIYYTPTPSALSVQVVFREHGCCWSVAVFQDADLLTEFSSPSLYVLGQKLTEIGLS